MPSPSGQAAYNLVGTLVSLALYGCYLGMFGATLHILCFKRKFTPFSVTLLVASVIMFFTIGAATFLSCGIIFDAFIILAPVVDPDIYLNATITEAAPSYLGRQCLQSLTMLIADAILVYRAWIICKPRWPVIAVSLVLWMFSLAFMIPMIVRYKDVGTSEGIAFYGYLVSTITQNIVTTFLIVFRLWRADSAASKYRNRKFMPIVWILVESGGFYVAFLIVQLFCILFDGNLADCVILCQSPIIGLVNSLIVVRMFWRYNNESTGRTAAAATTTTTTAMTSSTSSDSHTGDTRPQESIQVTIVRNLQRSAEDVSSYCETKNESQVDLESGAMSDFAHARSTIAGTPEEV